MIKHGEANPLNVFGLRELNHCPPHFIKLPFDLHTSVKEIRDWIYENLAGRFYIGSRYITSGENGKLQLENVVAFEDHSEATYFSLCLPQFNQNTLFLI